ncbi:hypothetical protein SETIT_8G139900v2 [Setaria italica]|uniref:Chalcone synthase n=1 Tax=Setaria italica TaxID=4555 RepID=K3ZIQ5_SETIT|nr:bisdemethoxycurcumin synthase [Setaria italica]RCV38407.1 hypothetical protein SETIT_8G139900v2 [Setaria italica]
MAATGSPATVIQDARRPRSADGHAAVLAIGTANPSHCLLQDEFADWYFRVSNSDHLAMLKAKMKRICEKSGIKKRHGHLTEEMLAAHPEILDRALPSLDTRMRIAAGSLPDVAAAAAARAIAEWGRPAADITHLVVSTTTGGAAAPGLDLHLAVLLGLRQDVQRTLLYLYGCTAGTSALRVAKDLAENTRGARVLVVSAETGLTFLRSPDEAQFEELVAAALFADGAGSAVVGAGPVSPAERPIFHMVSATQTTLAATARVVELKLGELGIEYRLSAALPAMVCGGIERCLSEALAPHLHGLAGAWNDLFWAAHPGSRAILDSYEAALGLQPEKLAASRRVLSEYGNMLGATVFFVLEEMWRRRGANEEEREKCAWGVMLGLGPGITVETMLLHAAGSQDED